MLKRVAIKKKILAVVLAMCSVPTVNAGLQDGFGATFTALAELEQALCQKFEGTWTILNELDDSFTSAQSGLESVIDTLTNELLYIFTSLDALEASACDKFEQTWTIIAELRAMVDPLVCQKFNETFTALSVIVPTQCDKFEQLWVDIQGLDTTVEELVDTINSATVLYTNKFEQTWTALDATQNNICRKFQETWTALDELRGRVDNFFTDEFEQTWTALDELNQELCFKFDMSSLLLENVTSKVDSLTTLINDNNEQTTSFFEQTWTALDDFKDVMCDKFEQTFTAIEALLDDPSGMNPSIIDTFTTLIEVSLADTITEIVGTDTIILCGKFEQTWTALDAVSNLVAAIALESEGADLTPFFTALNDFEENICDKFDDTQTILSCVSPVALQAPTTISVSGSYCLPHDITASNQGGVTISASNVTLDLNGYEIRSSSVTDNGVEVTTGINNVVIKNGTIAGFARGVVTDNNSKVMLKNMCIRECTERGIDATDTDHLSVIKTKLLHNATAAVGSDYVINCVDVNSPRFKDITIVENGGVSSALTAVVNVTTPGFSQLIGAIFEDVLIARNVFDSGATATSGMRLERCNSVQLIRCRIMNMDNISAGISTAVGGFFLMRDCCIQDLSNTNGDLVGIDGTSLTISVFDRCVIQNLVITSASSSQNCIGFDPLGNANMYFDCKALNLRHQGTNGGFCSGFRIRAFGLSDHHNFVRCIAQCCEGIQTTTVAGFDIQDPEEHEFRDCQALNNNNTSDASFSFGFLESDGSGGSITGRNAYIRCVAWNNGDPCLIANQFFSFGGTEMASWVEEKASATSMIPTMTPFQSLAIKSN